jgi:hypothetical protein
MPEGYQRVQPAATQGNPPSSTSGMETIWRDLRASIQANDEIPGSLKLSVLKGERLVYDELLRQVMDRGVPLEDALQRCELVIRVCDASSKQLKADSDAIEE